VRPARAVMQAAQRATFGLLGAAPALPPLVGGGDRDAEALSGLALAGAGLDRLDQFIATGESELGPRMRCHPGPPSRFLSFDTHEPRAGPGRLRRVPVSAETGTRIPLSCS